MGQPPPDDPTNESADLPVLILYALVEDPRRQNGPCSLARLAGRLDVRQSTLRRALSLLGDAGLVEVELHDDGGGEVSLTADGRALWIELSEAAEGDTRR